VRAFATHVGDDRALAVGRAAPVDAGQFAYARMTAVGAEQQARAQAPAAGQRRLDASVVLRQRLDRLRAMALDARFACDRLPQPIDQQAMLDDVAEFGLAEGIGVEDQLAAAGRVPHAHVGEGLGARGRDARPRAEVVEQRGRIGRERVHAQVGGVLAPGRRAMRLDQGDALPVARQRQRGAGADHAATDDHDVGVVARLHADRPA
jgi:hypothetical protein